MELLAQSQKRWPTVFWYGLTVFEERKNMIFSSKIDFWVLAVLVTVPSALLVAALVVHSVGLGMIAATVVALYRVALIPTNYRFG
jgi:hypothetical protein